MAPTCPRGSLRFAVMIRRARTPWASLGLALAAPGVALVLGVAGPAAAAGTTLVDLALDWAHGEYIAPMICQQSTGPARVGRRLMIKPAPRPTHRPMNRLVFFPIGVEGADRCKSELGGFEPDIQGALTFAFNAHAHPDLARAEFARALRMDRGFDFEVLKGRLRLSSPDGAPAREVDFAGGRAEFLRVERGSDPARILAEFGERPKRTLALEAKDGTRLVFHMVLLKPL